MCDAIKDDVNFNKWLANQEYMSGTDTRHIYIAWMAGRVSAHQEYKEVGFTHPNEFERMVKTLPGTLSQIQSTNWPLSVYIYNGDKISPEMIAGVKSSINRSLLTITLDDDDPDPQSTVETIIRPACGVNREDEVFSDHSIRHITKAGTNIFSELGFPPEEADQYQQNLLNHVQKKMDETEYLLSSKNNEDKLMESIEQVKAGQAKQHDLIYNDEPESPLKRQCLAAERIIVNIQPVLGRTLFWQENVEGLTESLRSHSDISGLQWIFIEDPDNSPTGFFNYIKLLKKLNNIIIDNFEDNSPTFAIDFARFMSNKIIKKLVKEYFETVNVLNEIEHLAD